MKLRSLGMMLAAASLVSGCGGDPDPKTFVVVNLVKGTLPDGDLSKVGQVDLELKYTGDMTTDKVEISVPAPGLMFPATKSLELVKGMGELEIKAVARMAPPNLTKISEGTCNVNVERDKTAMIDVTFGMVCAVIVDMDKKFTSNFVAPMVYDFGTVALGKMSGVATFKITNTDTVKSGPVMVTLDNVTQFSIATNDCRTRTMGLDPGAACTVGVQATPGSTAGTPTAKLTVTATGDYRATVSMKATSVPAGMVGTSPGDVAITGVAAGATSTPQPITFTNNTGAPLAQPTITINGTDAGRFAVVNNCTSTIAAAATCTADVTFSPNAAMQQVGATLLFNSGPTQMTVGLTGTAN